MKTKKRVKSNQSQESETSTESQASREVESTTEQFYIPLSVNIITQAKDVEYLADCLATIPKGAEVIIINNVQSEDKKCVEFDGEMFLNGLHIKQYSWYYKLFDFSQARNIALKYSTRDWILWLDTDDRLLLSDSKYYQELSEVPTGVGGFVCGCVGYLQPYLDNNGGSNCAPQLRIFRRHEKFKWSGIVHEQIISCIENEQMQIKSSPILIQHIGYEQDIKVMYKKLERNVELLVRQLAVFPDQDKRYYQEYLINSLTELHKIQDNLK